MCRWVCGTWCGVGGGVDTRYTASDAAAAAVPPQVAAVVKAASETGNAPSLVPALFQITPSVPIPPELATQGAGELAWLAAPV